MFLPLGQCQAARTGPKEWAPSRMGDAREMPDFAPARKATRSYFLPAISAAVRFVLGGEVAVSGGECAPDASSGFGAEGVDEA